MQQSLKVTFFVTIFIVAEAFFVARPVFAAQLVSDVSLFWGQSKSTSVPSDPADELKYSTLRAQVSLGWLAEPQADSSVYLGAVLGQQRDSSAGVQTSGEWLGVGLGYFFENGLRVRGFYSFNAAYGSNTAGQGLLVDVGWWRRVSSRLALGVVLNYQATQFSDVSTDLSSIYPALVFGGYF